MSDPDSSIPTFLATIEHLGRRYSVTCRIAFDGIEHVGRLWFAEEDWDQTRLPDRAASSRDACPPTSSGFVTNEPSPKSGRFSVCVA
jgi:hypothetical protein